MRLQYYVLALLVCSCTKAGDSSDNEPPKPPTLSGWYLDRAQVAAREVGASATSSGDTLIIDYEDYTRPIDDSAVYRQRYASPIARYIALKTYFELWPNGQVKSSAFDYDYSLNSFMVFRVYAYKPMADTSGLFRYEMGTVRYWFVSRYAANYSF